MYILNATQGSAQFSDLYLHLHHSSAAGELEGYYSEHMCRELVLDTERSEA